MPDGRDQDGHVELNSRQRQLATKLVTGATNASIADPLGISSATVAAHLKRILERAALRNRVELAVWAMEHDECCLASGPER